jgi:transposase
MMTSCRACGATISAKASTCPHCGAVFNRTLVAPVGIALMLAIAVLYAIFQRYQ